MNTSIKVVDPTGKPLAGEPESGSDNSDSRSSPAEKLSSHVDATASEIASDQHEEPATLSSSGQTAKDDSKESEEDQSQKMLRRFVRFEQRESVALMILAGLAVLYTLFLTRAIALPITFALLIAFTLRPIVRVLKRRHIPNTVGALIIVFVLVLFSLVAIFRVLEPAQQWSADAPQNIKLLKEKLQPLREKFGGISKSSEVIQDATNGGAVEPISVQIKQSSLSSNLAIMSTTGNIIGSMVLVLTLSFFFLAYGDDLTNSALHLMSTYSEKKRAVELIHGVERGIASYLLTVTVINFLLGVAVAGSMYLCGVPNPMLWGFMAFSFNYIPILGALAGGAILLAVSFLAFDSLLYACVPPMVFLTLTTIEGNFITPSILGRRMNLNPILVFIALIFWGWAWGLGGAILAVPLLAITKIACEGFERTLPIAIMIGDTRERGDPS